MKSKIFAAAMLTVVILVAVSNIAFSQATKVEAPQLFAQSAEIPLQMGTAFHPRHLHWVDKSSSLPGIVSTKTIVIASVSLVAVGAAIILVIHHNKHNAVSNNTQLIPGLNPNFDVNMTLNNNIKGVGVRYAFK